MGDSLVAELKGLHEIEGRRGMSNGTTDEIKGRVKEAAGALAGDEELKREGRVDQLVGRVKQMTNELLDRVRALVKRS